MTEPTQAAKQRACDLANAQLDDALSVPDDVNEWNPTLRALAQLCQDISDAVEAIDKPVSRWPYWERLAPFILPKPAPDPLAEALRSTPICETPEARAQLVRAALAQRGHEVAPIKPTTA